MKWLLLLLLVSGSVFSFDWQGHRGARGLYPENTIGAMEVALQYPVTTLEMDVVVTKDHKVVLGHDPWMNEEICLDPQGKEVKLRQYNIYKMNYEEVIKFDCGSKLHPLFPEQQKVTVGKPTLENLLKHTEKTIKKLNRHISYNVEIVSTPLNEKLGFQPEYQKFTDLVISVLKAQLPLDRFTVQSFDWRVLRYLHKKYPEIRIIVLKMSAFDPQQVINELGFRPYAFSPFFKHVTKENVEALKRMRIKVVPWTVNELVDLRNIKALGVDGIITDYPDRIEKLASLKCKKKEHYFDGSCVKLPKHAIPSDSIPGWSCKQGYVQKRSRCIKIDLPPNAHLSQDGKTWVCKEGFKKYRSTCIK